jgi:glucose/arabinose dehydrogenase
MVGLALGAGVLGLGSIGADTSELSDTAPGDESFQKVTLNGAPGEPIGLAVLPDGRVLHTTRNGRVLLHDPSTGLNSLAASISVYQHDEEGLQGIALDPHFEHNHWVYIYHSPRLDTPLDDAATPDINEGDAPEVGTAADWERFRGVMRLSRFKLEGNQLDLASEQNILEVPVDRGRCCHVGGQVDFDADGNLFLSTGDDTDPFVSDGFSPIDERLERHPAFDAQRSSANTNDLRGKLLRIRVKPDGSYTIPRGNLFVPGTAKTRPEIYAMGLRNPFRFSVDRKTGDVFLADYSPDSPVADPARGPAGQGKWTVVRAPGNYGWPYCATAELPYVDFDFATLTSGAPFDCQAPVNESPRNTGLRRLPPVVQPELWYGNALSPELPVLGEGGVAPMAGPAYRYSSRSSSLVKWPRYFDGVPIFYEWSRDRMFEVRLDATDDPGALPELRPLLPSIIVDNPIDMEFGRDGALYVLEYGDGFNSENPEAQLARIDYVRGNFSPVPVLDASPLFGRIPLTVQLSSAGSTDPDGDAISVSWDLDGDGTVDSTEPNPTLTYEQNGIFSPTLRVVDSTGRAANASTRIIVGNEVPVIEFLTPTPDQTFTFGDVVSYELLVTDDQPVDCARVAVTYGILHDEHGHGLSTAQGCSGSFVTLFDAGHAGAEGLAAGFLAEYTDAPTEPGVPALFAQALIRLEQAPAP